MNDSDLHLRLNKRKVEQLLDFLYLASSCDIDDEYFESKLSEWIYMLKEYLKECDMCVKDH